MTSIPPTQPPGWYYAQGDPPGTQRYWDGVQWQGGPQAIPGAEASGGMGMGVFNKSHLASPWLRLVARIIDAILVFIPSFLIGSLLGGTEPTGDSFSSIAFNTSGSAILAGLIGGLIGLAYEYFFLAKDGATLGKKAVSIKVVLEDGSPLGSNGAMRRLALAAIGVVPLVGGLVGIVVFLATIVMIFADDRRQVPADKIAKSLVIKD